MELKLESRPVIVLAHGRTGTNLLRKILSASDEFQDFGEIFNPDNWRNRASKFWDFYSVWLQADPQRTVTSVENRTLLFADYLAALDSICTKPFMLIDIKYGNVANLNPCHHFSDQKPFLFNLIAKYRIPVIHLMRRNLLEQHCSMHLARETGNWIEGISNDPPKPRDQSIIVDVDQLIDNLTRMALRVQFYDSFLSHYDRYLRLHYEDLLQDGSLADSTRQSIGQLLNRLLTVDGTPQTRKVSPPLSTLIANYDAVEKTLRDTPFAAMLEARSSPHPPRGAPDDIAQFSQSTS